MTEKDLKLSFKVFNKLCFIIKTHVSLTLFATHGVQTLDY